MKKNYQKRIINEIGEIDNFLKTENLRIQHNQHFPINDCKISISKNPEKNYVEFDVEFKTEIHPNKITFNKLGFNENFKIVSENKNFIIPSKSVNSITGKHFVPSIKLNGEISTIFSESFPLETDSYFRSILIIEENNLTTIFLGSEYSCDETYYSLGLIIIEIEGFVYHVFRHCKDNLNYLVIESLDKVSFPTFKLVAELTLKSIGLLTGNWHQNEQYIFAYKLSGFEMANSIYYESLNNSVITNQEIINPNEFRIFVQGNSDRLPKLTPLLFPQVILSNLITNLKLKPELERTIDLLIESKGIDPPIIKCSIFHVALETIIGLINKENKDFFEPIKNSESLEDLKEKFQIIIDKKRSIFNHIEYETLVKKIKYINTPFNKDKFILAFELYNIELPKRLKELLDTRNKFLHGKTPYKESTLKTKSKELNLDADRIHLLVSILILKYSDYTGHIKNYAGYRLKLEKFFEETDIENEESTFYEI